MMRLVTFFLGGLMLAGGSWAEGSLEGDPDAGRKLAGQCRTCHGLNGIAQIPIAPNIGGESADYLARQLTAFRDGTRQHEMMTVVTKMLTDQQIADVAAWFASHEVTATMSGDPSGAPELCAGCHGEDGIAVIEDAPNLAGETTIYIDTQLKAFRLGKRESDIMSGIAAELTDDEIRAAATWYESVKLESARPE